MKPYRPSNGTEGMWFEEKFCDRCLNHHPDPNSKPQCLILMRAFMYVIKDKEYPEEWQYNEYDKPTCTAWVKWDWGRDDNGNWIEPIIPPPDDPNQLVLPFLLEEIGIPEIKTVETCNT